MFVLGCVYPTSTANELPIEQAAQLHLNSIKYANASCERASECVCALVKQRCHDCTLARSKAGAIDNRNKNKKIQSRTPKAEISYQRVIHTHTHSIDAAAAAAAFVKRASKIVWEIRSTATPNM